MITNKSEDDSLGTSAVPGRFFESVRAAQLGSCAAGQNISGDISRQPALRTLCCLSTAFTLSKVKVLSATNYYPER